MTVDLIIERSTSEVSELTIKSSYTNIISLEIVENWYEYAYLDITWAKIRSRSFFGDDIAYERSGIYHAWRVLIILQHAQLILNWLIKLNFSCLDQLQESVNMFKSLLFLRTGFIHLIWQWILSRGCTLGRGKIRAISFFPVVGSSFLSLILKFHGLLLSKS